MKRGKDLEEGEKEERKGKKGRKGKEGKEDKITTHQEGEGQSNRHTNQSLSVANSLKFTLAVVANSPASILPVIINKTSIQYKGCTQLYVKIDNYSTLKKSNLA